MKAAASDIGLTPRGRLVAVPSTDAPILDARLVESLERAFQRGSGHVLFSLGARETEAILPPSYAYWRDFGGKYVNALCTRSEGPAEGGIMDVAAPPAEELELVASAAPSMLGAEYLSSGVLAELWREMDLACAAEFAEASCSLQEFLKRKNPAWNLVGRVYFNLAENRKDPDLPFAFLATYTTHLSSNASARHLPLGQALSEYAGAVNKDRLLSLLVPVQRAAEACPWLKAMVDVREIFHPLRWTVAEALRVLRDVPKLEAAGVIVRMPSAWRGNRPARPRVTATVGRREPSGVGRDALLDFNMAVTLDGEPLTPEEILALLKNSEELALVRGRWIEVDRDKLRGMIERFEKIKRDADENGIGFSEAMRMVAGASLANDGGEAADWSEVVAGPWLKDTLKGLRSPEGLAAVDPGSALEAVLRPYQQAGVRWLYLLAQLRLGACLADDMGLGKTIQVISLLLVLKREDSANRKPSLLVAPASLLANWAAEIERFAPGLKALVAHTSSMPAEELKSMKPQRIGEYDLVITSYGSLLRAPWVCDTAWRVAVIDEAQAIKNPSALQTKAVKTLKAGARIALTGTPVENRLGDLWSIFDFVNPGLLGTAKEFTSFTKKLSSQPHAAAFAPLRELVRPYILRRLKTDKSVIADLPDKTELKTYCSLSKQQAALYGQAVADLAKQLEDVNGIQRRGLILAYLMRFKQICNHPSHWLGGGDWAESESGKMARLRDLAEVIAAKQEKMLVFTQFRETTGPLAAFLSSIFGRPGLVLHGETAVKNRQQLVRRFQEDEGVGFFVLSLKAGGSGLNLTAASHVVHFDRWWNPAVENQATDRAFRIGQKRNVLVHKFVCRGTVEEKIDEMIESKRALARDVLESGADLLLTELKDDELLKLVALDINKALEEG